MEENKKMKCPKCGSTEIKKVEEADDFLSFKSEGGIANRAKTKTKQKYICLEENCGHEWEKIKF